MPLEYSNRRICAIMIVLGFSGIVLPHSTHAFASAVEYPTGCEEGISYLGSKKEIITDTVSWDVVSTITPIPANLQALSPICAYVRVGSGRVSFFYQHEHTPYRPRVYQWNAEQRAWRPFETTMDRTANTVTAVFKEARGVMGVFVDTKDVYEGTASWYRHARYPAGAATNIYPIGTKLRVTNPTSKKSTTVTVTSTWTNTNKERIIDLVSTAFAKIGNLRAGLITVRIERL